MAPRVLLTMLVGLLMLCLCNCGFAGRKPKPQPQHQQGVDGGSKGEDPVGPSDVVEPQPQPGVDGGSEGEDPVGPSDVFEEMAEAAEIFKRIDKNGDGTVSLKELRGAVLTSNKIRRALRLKNSRDARSFFEGADADENRKLDFEEFVEKLFWVNLPDSSVTTAKHASESIDKSTAEQIFKSIDKDKNLSLDKTELKAAYAAALRVKGQTPTKERLRQWATRAFKKYDTDKSQTLDFDELFQLCQNTSVLALG